MLDWPALITGLGTLVGLLIAWDARKTARKVESADAGESAAEAVKILLDPLTARIKTLEAQVEALQQRELHLVSEREERARVHLDELAALRAQMEANDRESKRIQAAMQVELDELKGGVIVLIAQLEEKDIRPRWKPKTGPLGEKK